jgi:SAM-dependent methyltransferase
VTSTKGETLDRLLGSADEFEEAGRPVDALAQAWQAFDLAPEALSAKRLIAGLLRRNPGLVTPERIPGLERMLQDSGIDPGAIAPAGWSLVLSQGAIARGGEPKAMADTLERHSLALLLLTETYVSMLAVELAITSVRRWLLLSGQWANYPRLAQALIAQAVLNGGAWPFDTQERDALKQPAARPFSAAYLPPRPPVPAAKRFIDRVTGEVADQYVRWPYPAWTRFTAPEPSTLPRVVEKLDGRGCELPIEAEVLVAGCGTGREAASVAKRFPDARVTAIDVSSRSLAYAEARCAGLGIDFRLLDLHEISLLGRRYDLIVCSGVLHHLPGPEAGWAKLVEALNPGGVMKVMLYSRVGRLCIQGAKTFIADLRSQPVDDDLLREARHRLIVRAPHLVESFYDFYNLAEVHDLLFNRHEDAFDVPRIARALDDLQLELLAFVLPSPAEKGRYRAEHPSDPLFRDVRAWGEIEKTKPFLFAGMYEFWCRRQV